MKGDEKRAELLATMLDGGPVADEIEPLTPAVRRVREMLDRLTPDPERVAALVPQLLRQLVDPRRSPAIELAHPTLFVRDMEVALSFYRGTLGLAVREEGKWLSILDAGGCDIALRWTGSATRKPRVGDTQLEFRTDDLDRAVAVLRRRSVPADVRTDRIRGRYAELRDPDGHLVVLLGGEIATQRISDPEEPMRASARKDLGE
jgi:catechol 2,3-dioxygenase-like lactoylglutathione lyase family enzyme